MRVLVLSGYETPSYPGGGGASRQHSLLEPLAKRHEIRVISTGKTPAFGKLPDGVDVRIVDAGEALAPTTEPWLPKNARHYLNGSPWLLRHTEHHARALVAEAQRAIPDFKPDLVQVEHGENLSLLHLLPVGLPTVLVLHNMLLTFQSQRAAEGTPWQRVKEVLELPLAARQTRRDLPLATITVTVTEHDRRLAERLAPTATVRVIPNCVDTSYLARRGPMAPEPTMLLTGTFHYQPNQHAAVELLRSILPEVRLQVPDARLVLAGQGMPGRLSGQVLRTEGATWVGELDDLRPHLWQAWVAVALLRKGSGSPLKVMEAMAAGVPVVTTRRVARALEVGEAEGVITADSTRDVVTAICALLQNPARRDDLSVKAARAARRRFDRGPAAERQEEVWQEAVGGGRRSPVAHVVDPG